MKTKLSAALDVLEELKWEFSVHATDIGVASQDGVPDVHNVLNGVNVVC